MVNSREFFVVCFLTIQVVCGGATNFVDVSAVGVDSSGSPEGHETIAGGADAESSKLNVDTVKDEYLKKLNASKMMQKMLQSVALSENKKDEDRVFDVKEVREHLRIIRSPNASTTREVRQSFCMLKICSYVPRGTGK